VSEPRARASSAPRCSASTGSIRRSTPRSLRGRPRACSRRARPRRGEEGTRAPHLAGARSFAKTTSTARGGITRSPAAGGETTARPRAARPPTRSALPASGIRPCRAHHAALRRDGRS
jgi:hypothetical protein